MRSGSWMARSAFLAYLSYHLLGYVSLPKTNLRPFHSRLRLSAGQASTISIISRSRSNGGPTKLIGIVSTADLGAQDADIKHFPTGEERVPFLVSLA